jgi:hypothetical protein
MHHGLNFKTEDDFFGTGFDDDSFYFIEVIMMSIFVNSLGPFFYHQRRVPEKIVKKKLGPPDWQGPG